MRGASNLYAEEMTSTPVQNTDPCAKCVGLAYSWSYEEKQMHGEVSAAGFLVPSPHYCVCLFHKGYGNLSQWEGKWSAPFGGFSQREGTWSFQLDVQPKSQQLMGGVGWDSMLTGSEGFGEEEFSQRVNVSGQRERCGRPSVRQYDDWFEGGIEEAEAKGSALLRPQRRGLKLDEGGRQLASERIP